MLKLPNGASLHNRRDRPRHCRPSPSLQQHQSQISLVPCIRAGLAASSVGNNGTCAMAELKEQALSFNNAHGERLAAKVVDAGSDDIVILCHGYGGNKDGFLYPQLAAELAARGKSSLRFDFAGNGESQGAFSFGNYYREVEDLRAAVASVRSELGKTVHAIVGHSKGGNVVLLYAARYDDVPHVVNIAGRGLMSRGVKERFGEDILQRLAQHGAVQQQVKGDGGRSIKYMLTKESVDERINMDMFAEAAKIGAEVLTVHGSGDTVIPVEDAHSFAKHIKHHTLCVVDGGDHNFRQPAAAQELKRRVVDFLVVGL